MKILIPKCQARLIEKVENYLRLAKSKGFSISVDLVISNVSTIELIDGNKSVISISSDLFEANSVSDIHVQYQSDSNVIGSRIVVRVNHFKDQRHIDTWCDAGGEHSLINSSQRHDVFDVHEHLGAFIAMLAIDFPLEDALALARAFQSVSRETWPTFSDFPIPNIEIKSSKLGCSNKFEAITGESLGLYPVVDSVELLEELLLLGVKTVQLRIKDPVTLTLRQEVIRSIQLGNEHSAQVFINDYWQLAIELGAFGVHLGQEDLIESNLNNISKAGLALGLSTHGYYELLKILEVEPSYIALGHIFPTSTKVMPSNPQGLTKLKLFQELVGQSNEAKQFVHDPIPTVAIGGIDLSNTHSVLETGVDSIAVVRAVTLSDNLSDTLSSFRCAFKCRSNKEIMVKFNEDLISLPKTSNVVDLLALQSVRQKGIVVSLNNEVLPRALWEIKELQTDDTISIFSAIAGG